MKWQTKLRFQHYFTRTTFHSSFNAPSNGIIIYLQNEEQPKKIVGFFDVHKTLGILEHFLTSLCIPQVSWINDVWMQIWCLNAKILNSLKMNSFTSELEILNICSNCLQIKSAPRKSFVSISFVFWFRISLKCRIITSNRWNRIPQNVYYGSLWFT